MVRGMSLCIFNEFLQSNDHFFLLQSSVFRCQCESSTHTMFAHFRLTGVQRLDLTQSQNEFSEDGLYVFSDCGVGWVKIRQDEANPVQFSECIS